MSTNHRVRLLVSTLCIVSAIASGCSSKNRTSDLLDRANRHFSAGQYDEAEIIYKNVLQQDRSNAAALARLGLIYHEQSRTARALPLLLTAKDLDPANLETRVALGYTYLGQGRVKEARDEALFVLQKQPQDPAAPLILVEAASANLKDRAETRKILLGLPETAPPNASVPVALGILELREKKPKEAAAAFERARQLDPKSAAAATAIGMLQWAQNQIPAADAALKEAADLSPPRSPRRLTYAQFKLQTGNAAAAKSLLETMSARTPDHLGIWVLLAEVALAERNYPQSETYLAKALARDASHPESIMLRARLHQLVGETDKAITELENLLIRFPKSPLITYQLGLAYAAKGDTAKASSYLTQATVAAPGMAHSALALAEINIRRRDFGPAIAALRQLIQERPDIPMARALLAEAHRGQGNFDDAAAIYQTLEIQFPKDPQTPFWRATVLLQQNKLEEARKAFERARELAPDNLSIQDQLVALDVKKKDFASALRRLDAELERRPKLVELQLMRAHVLRAKGDKAAAESALQRATELAPESPAAPFMLAQMYVDERQFDKALAALNALVERHPKNVGGPLLMGSIYERLKNPAAARQAYEKALANDSNNVVALNNLAFLHAERFGEIDKAYELAQRARTAAPQEPRAADTLGWILWKKRLYSQALGLLQESAGKLPDEAEVQYHLGMAHYMLNDQEPARLALQRSLQLKGDFGNAEDARQRLALLKSGKGTDRRALEARVAEQPDDPVALARLAEAQQSEGDADRALASYRTLVQISPKNATAWISLARLQAAKQDLAGAIESARTARTLAPGNAEIAHTLGRLAFQSGDHRWAASLLQDVARTRPDDPDVALDWAQIAYSVGRVEEASSSMRRGLELAPTSSRASEGKLFLEMLSLASNPELAATAARRIEQASKSEATVVPALMVMGALADRKHDRTSSQQIYEKVLQRYPAFSPAQRQLTLLYAMQPNADIQKAAGIAAKARQALPNDLELARAVAIIAYRQGDFSKVASMLTEMSRKKAADGEMMYYLGMAQWQLNRRNEGRVALERALELGVPDALAAEARKSLARVP